MFNPLDDVVLVQAALSQGIVLEDEVRECRYEQKERQGTSIVSILRERGFLDEKNFLHLFKIHVDRELRRAVAQYLGSLQEKFSSRVVRALIEAEATYDRRIRGVSLPGGPASSILVCADCGTKYDTTVLKPGASYKCRKCGNVLRVPEQQVVEELEPEPELEEAFDAEDLVGTSIGGCQVVERIGEGGMGVVYLGKHLTLDRSVAIKVLPRKMTTKFFRERFLAESRAAARLIHPNVVQIFDAGEERGNPYIIMEYVEGVTVKQLINTRKRLGLAFVIRVIGEAAQGLGAAHKLKMVHRDVKPENIMISFSGETKVMDFGLAKDVGMQGDVTKAGMLMGTPYYMAPEQFKSDVDVDHRADIYALGVTLYHMLVGSPPFLGDSPYKIMNAHLNERYKPVREANPDVPPQLEAVLDKMLAKDRQKRYQAMQQVVRDLERVELTPEQAASGE
jgi:predicted Ser/Thr protein kinase